MTTDSITQEVPLFSVVTFVVYIFSLGIPAYFHRKILFFSYH